MKMINQIVEELKRLKGVDVVLEAPVKSSKELRPCKVFMGILNRAFYEQNVFGNFWVSIELDLDTNRVTYSLPLNNSENILFPKIEDVKSAVNKIIEVHQKQKLNREAELEKEIKFLEEKLSILKGEKESLV